MLRNIVILILRSKRNAKFVINVIYFPLKHKIKMLNKFMTQNKWLITWSFNLDNRKIFVYCQTKRKNNL